MLPIRILTSNYIFKYYRGFSFFIFIWISRLEQNRERLVRHEMIHFAQQVELLFVFHWLFYAVFYLWARVRRKPHYVAYRYNPFELEAYCNDNDSDYLRRRKRFAWWLYIRQFRESLTQDLRHTIPPDGKATW